MKRLSIVILSVILSMSLCLPVMALDLDLIEEEKKEEIIYDYKEYDKNEENYSKSAKTLNTASYQLVDVGKYNPIPEPTPGPTPTPDVPTVSDNTVSDNDISVSWNSVSENLISIEEQLRGLRKDVQNLANNTFSVSISNINVSDNQVNRNVISTGLQDYDLGEQLQLIGLILAFGALLVYIIHKSIYKWGR